MWQVSPKIVLTIVGIYAVLWILTYFMGSEKAKAKKIFKIYRPCLRCLCHAVPGPSNCTQLSLRTVLPAAGRSFKMFAQHSVQDAPVPAGDEG